MTATRFADVFQFLDNHLHGVIHFYRHHSLTRPEAAQEVRDLLAKCDEIEDSWGGSFPILDHFRDRCWDFLLS